MEYKNRKIIYDSAINKYGNHMQQMVAIEEMSELIKELVKHSRGAENNGHIAEENSRCCHHVGATYDYV